ncbi:hypothetical protein JCM33774_39800 [Actinophytocola sp. KF-1]
MAGQEQAPHREAAPAPARRWWLHDRRLAYGIEILAVLPALVMALEVAAAPKLQQLDYWAVLLRIVNPDGTFDWGGVWSLHNEHPLIVPSFFYWVDARYFDGDNRILGYLTVVIAAATVLLLRFALPRMLPDVLRAGLVVATSALVFSLHGTHNFALGMSGAAWLTANLFVIIALIFAMKRQWWVAWAAGLVACLSYGTGFAVWPALLLIGFMVRERWWIRITTVVLGIVVVAEWLRMRPDFVPDKSQEADIGNLVHAFITLVGHLWTGRSADLAAIAGALVLAGLVAMLTVPFARTRRLWFWWALALYGVLASGMIALAREDFGNDVGLASRYTSLSVLTSLPLLVIVVTVAFRKWPRSWSRFTIAVVTVGLLGFTLGAPTVTVVRSGTEDTPLKAIALRAQLDDRFWPGFPPTRRIASRLKALGHYPFNDDFTLGCGGPELGDRLDMDEMRPMTKPEEDQERPTAAIDDAQFHGNSVLLRGWAVGGRSKVTCVLVVDADGKVTGGGQYHLPRPDVENLLGWGPRDPGFTAIGKGDPEGRVVFLLDDGWQFWLPLPVRE